MIKVTNEINLTPFLKKDKADLIRYISHPDISNNTLTVPFPYRESDADEFLKMIQAKEKRTGKVWNWVIRNKEGNLIGSIGLLGKPAFGNPDLDVFGYWIGEEFWGNGIMTKVVKSFSDYCLNERGLVRLEASVFPNNQASIKVLEKAGFEQEGYLKKKFLKRGEYLDCILFAKTKEHS